MQKYEGVVTDVLFDQSGGQGVVIDVETAWQFTEMSLGSYGMGIAGGLEADALQQLQKYFRFFRDISIDAQGKLRDKNDDLDLRKAKAYVDQAFALLNIR